MNGLSKQVFSIPCLYQEIFPILEKQTHTILSTPEIFSVKKVFIFGSGDSYAAALSAKYAFEQLLQIPICVLDPLDLVCYEQMKWVGESPFDPLVIAISNSGMAERTCEAAAWMKAHNALTIGITSNGDSLLARICERVIDVSIPKSTKAPGCRSFFVLQLTLYLLAMRFGTIRLKFHQEERQNCFTAIGTVMHELEVSLGMIESACTTYANQFTACSSVEAIGTGPDYGTARYCQLKCYEAAGLPCVLTNSENWFHENYFLRNQERTPVLVFSSKGNMSQSRTEELISRMDEMNRKYLLVDDYHIQCKGNQITLPSLPYSWLQPLVTWMVPALFASHLCEILDEKYQRDFEGIWEKTEGSFNTVNTKPIRGEAHA